jgi:pimeloyl-ACP methyl ester carboxylesterase
MELFNISLANGDILSGRYCLPPATAASPQKRPLIIAIHGGTMTSKYYDLTPDTSAAPIAMALGFPFVAIDRPGYGASSGLPPRLQEGDSWHQQEGRHLHQQILPALWNHFGRRSGAASMVMMAHSLGAPGSIVASALHADEPHTYPLSGAIWSGCGFRSKMPVKSARAMLQGKTPEDRISFPKELATMGYLGGSDSSFVDKEVYALLETGDILTTMSYGEFHDALLEWPNYWKTYAQKVRVPIMYVVPEADTLADGSAATLEEFAHACSSAAKVDRGTVAKAPHCLEWTIWSRAWFMRCFGFAAECVSAEGVPNQTV